MSKATQSILVWSGYLLVLGVLLLVAPEWVLGALRIEAVEDPVWVRLVGLAVAVLGYYHLVIAQQRVAALLRATVAARVLTAAALLALAASGAAALVVFALIEAAGAAWTVSSLRSTAHARPRTRPRSGPQSGSTAAA